MMMDHRFGAAATSVALLALLTFGCSNPADDKPEAAVADPEPVPERSDEAAVFTVDPERSSIHFVGSKITGSHDGGFHQFEGVIELVDGDPTASSVTVEIDTTSLWADDTRLTEHLKSPDFFGVETYPQAVFESTSIEQTADGYTVTGNLDLHGVTKSVSFPAQIEVGPDSVTARAEFFIKRFDFDIVYPGKPDDLIRDEVVIRFDLTAVPPGDDAGMAGDA
ncbi:MAG TPA: YceI family protein [Candidatus Polarisedimenticolaceae bacterium]|nr:YceI family protein [Candidatus Polarisedimenticolaceae bacterium]